MPYHKLFDSKNEKRLGDKAIGVTGKGIGPAYTDKYKRSGIRIVDIYDKDLFRNKINNACENVKRVFAEQDLTADLNVDQIYDYYIKFDERIDPLIKDISVLLNNAIDDGKRIICEGSQGTLLDIDWGTYPFVTSSNPTAGGAVTGLGIGPTKIDSVMGIIKAYTTRVGQGPFPTEFGDELGALMTEAGEEYGATTGRARRCGWFDAVIGRFSARVNGVASWALTKLDILSQFDTIKICTSYEYNGKRIDVFPTEKRVIEGCEPRYEEMQGWQEPISHIKEYDDLPKAAKLYVSRIEELTGTPVEILSVGSDREETIYRRV
jgi:adenylosuccinate synthase